MNIDNKKRCKYFLSNVIAFLFGSMGTKLIGFIMVPLYTNMLLPQEYGEIDFLLSAAGMISPFVAVGIHEGIMRFCLDKGVNHKLILSIGLRIFLASSVLFGLLIPILSVVPMVSENLLFLYFYCILQEYMTILLCYIRGKDDVKLYSFLGFLSALFVAFLNVLFIVVLHWGVAGYKITMILSPIMTAVAAILLGRLKEEFTIKLWNKKLATDILKYSVVLIPNSLLWNVINTSDRFFVSYMCGTAENGLYAVAYKLPTLLNVVASIIMQSWQMSAINEHGNENSSEFYDQMYRCLIFMMGVATLGLLLVNRTVLSIYVGPEYQSAWIYSPPLIVAFFAGAIGIFWSAFYIAEKNTTGLLIATLIGAILNIILNYVMISAWGTIGAAVATAICYIITVVVQAYGIRKRVHLNPINKQIVTASICIAMSVYISYLNIIQL